MEYIIFTNGTKKFPCWVSKIGNVVSLHFKDDIPSKSTMRGFTWHYSDISEPCDYTEFNTVYRYEDGVYQLSNDGSIYVEPVIEEIIEELDGSVYVEPVIEEEEIVIEQ